MAHESLGMGDEEEGHKVYGVAENQGGTAREWEGELSRRRALTPTEWQSCPGGTKPL